MSIGNDMSPADIRACTEGNSGYGGGSGSEFAAVARAAGMSRLLEVLDEHMECVKVLYPKEYAAVIRRLKD